jgi:hypothetical protein
MPPSSSSWRRKPRPKALSLVAEWHQFENGKISHVESAFDGRPYEAMFTSGTPT